MSPSPVPLRLLAGRLSVDFANTIPATADLSWDTLIGFLEASHIATPERARELLALSHSDPQATEALLGKAQRLGTALRNAFSALIHRQKIPREWVERVNEILRVTEQSRAATLDDLGGCVFRADLATMHHETQRTRLFRS